MIKPDQRFDAEYFVSLSEKAQRVELAALAQELLDFWLPRFGLSDWEVKVTLARWFDMETERAVGFVSWSVEHYTADIKILNPIDFTAARSGWTEYDFEHTLVHEVAHIAFRVFEEPTEDKPCTKEQEQMINRLARSLVDLRRTAPGV